MIPTLPSSLAAFYPASMAALTAPVRFVEWKVLQVQSWATPASGTAGGPSHASGVDWNPMAVEQGDGGDTKMLAYAEIEGPRWIYVFARPAGNFDPPTLVEELFLDPDPGRDDAWDSRVGPRHTIYATPLGSPRFDGGGPHVAPLDTRPKGEQVGRTMRFVRRLRGKPMVHYFFATRVRLAPAHLEKLRQNVALWTPPTYFEAQDPKATETIFGEKDPNVGAVEGQGDQRLLVPVLDPITVATHLHALFSAAADDLLEYVGYDGQDADDRKAALQRQQKLLLARVIQIVVAQNKDRRGDLSSDSAVDDWIAEAERQVDSRTYQRDRWATYLWNWLRAAPLQFLQDVHFAGDTTAMALFVPMMLFFTRGNETAAGREGLRAILSNDGGRWDWVHQHVIPDEVHVAKGTFKVSRKFISAVLEAATPLVATVALDKGTVEAMRRLQGLRSVYGLSPFTLDGRELPEDAEAAARAFHLSPSKQIEAPELVGAQKVWKHRFTSMKLVLNAINLALYFSDVVKDPTFDKILGTAGAGANLAKAAIGFAKIAKGSRLALTKEMLGYFAGVVDAYLGIQGVRKAVVEGDSRVEVGYVMISVGGLLSTFGPMLVLAGEGGPIVVLGYIIATIGYAIVYFWAKDPLTKFLEHCPWGDKHYLKMSYDDLASMKGLEMVPGDFLGQLEVLLHLLCRFELESDDTPKEDDDPNLGVGVLTLGWTPPGAKLFIDWQEDWGERAGGGGAETITGTATYTFDQGATLVAQTGSAVRIEHHGDDKNEYTVAGQGRGGKTFKGDAFEFTRFLARLTVSVGDQTFVIPKSQPLELMLDADAQWKKKEKQRGLTPP